ncbi:sensor histidine kinase [Ornithinibacillus bavariensis]|uniref:sensor histidine kinase n=1 Tax=Ornithinibacillus bavariensis TaxID=545502 RepID=UPI000ED78FCA|nr:sensor histidine kinase [Ornithinibacillus sp.]
MYQFWLRFFIFLLLWAYMIVEYSLNKGISMLFLAAAVGAFFFLSLQRVSIILYLGLSVVIVLHGIFFVEGNLLTIILLLYVTMISSLRLSENKLRFYIILNVSLSLIVSFVQQLLTIELTIMAVLFYSLMIMTSVYQNYFKEQKNLYEKLLGEYRKLKRLNLSAEQNARVEERNRIARDIHDSVGHRLTALIMQLEVLAIQSKNEGYRELKKMAEESLEETRHAVKALQNEENEGIATVVHLIRKLEAESHLFVQFTIKQGVLSIPLSNEKSVVLFRVIQEALTNAMRHGHSKEVQVIIGKSAIGDVTFEVSNMVHKAKSFEYGFGLTNMKSRLEEINGRLEVYQTNNQFFVTGTIPALEVNNDVASVIG